MSLNTNTRFNLIHSSILYLILVLIIPFTDSYSEAQEKKEGDSLHVFEDYPQFKDLFMKDVFQCIELCIEAEIERTVYECAPYFAPPTKKCDLPGINPFYPTPDPNGFGDLCIPEEPKLGGYHLREVEHVIVTRLTKNRKDCTSSIIEGNVQHLPPSNIPPARECSFKSGAWRDVSHTFLSFNFVACPK